jgi:ribosomal protein S18 acetylase RimI-like enzyme
MNIHVTSPRAAAFTELQVAVGPATTPTDRARALAVIAYGFIRDPIARWVWPTAEIYAAHMPAFVEAFSGRALEHSTADLTACGGAAAFWLPPGVEPDEEAVMAVLDRSVPKSRAAEMEEFFAQMARFHPTAPSWYLPQIAADPACQGRGLGSALLTHRLSLIDAEGTPAYLESSNPANIPLYRRHGFEVIGEIQAGSSPVMYPMVRRGRG